MEGVTFDEDYEAGSNLVKIARSLAALQPFLG
jgi:hypothetical protein